MKVKLLIFSVLIISSVIVEGTPTEYWSTEDVITETEPTTTSTKTTTLPPFIQQPDFPDPPPIKDIFISSSCSRCYVKDSDGVCRFNVASCSEAG